MDDDDDDDENSVSINKLKNKYKTDKGKGGAQKAPIYSSDERWSILSLICLVTDLDFDHNSDDLICFKPK